MKTFNRLAVAGAMILAVTAAEADVVVVVSASSPVGQLSKDQVADIFLGNSANIPGGGKAEPVDNDGAREEFYTKVAGKSGAQVKALWAKLSFSGKGTPPKSVGSDDDVKKAVAGNPNAIGYIEKSKVDSSVKTVLAP
jgi:ABC-type phosphate transport system substrate-binding protein